MWPGGPGFPGGPCAPGSPKGEGEKKHITGDFQGNVTSTQQS